MKICYLSAANSYHTQKWCKFFSERGHEVHLITLTPGECPYAETHIVKTRMNDRHDSTARKFEYLLHGKEVKKIISEIRPDIIHAHRIPSYGGLCAFSGIRPFVLSLWGGDVFTFPRKSLLHKKLVKFTLKKADCIMSTSKAMREEARKYTNKNIEITPFGVDMELFSPSKDNKAKEYFTIGTVKNLERVYGIDYILQAAATVIHQRKDIPLRVKIAGMGSQEASLKELSKKLGINDIVQWLGFISQEQAAKEWNSMDIAVIPSRSESFGVSAVEAQACGTPVIISDISGLKEATSPGISSIVVSVGDTDQIAKSIIELYDSPERRRQMGSGGRKYVFERYEREKCFSHIENIYKKLVSDPRWNR